MENSIITLYSLKKHRNSKFRFYMILVSDLGCILASFPGPLAMIFDICSSLVFGCFFGCIFHGARHQNGPQMALQMDRESQKNRNLCSPVQFGRTRRQFDSVFGSLWSSFGTFWASLGSHLGSLLDIFGLFRAYFGHHLRTDWHVAKFVPPNKKIPLLEIGYFVL